MGAAPGAAPAGAARDPKATPQIEVSLLDPGQFKQTVNVSGRLQSGY